MKPSFSRLLVFFLVAATLLIPQASAQLANIPDPNLKQAIREELRLPDEIPLTQPEMLRLKDLKAVDRGITDLTGLEHATFLEEIQMDGSQIRDLRPLTSLNHLKHLGFIGSQISDIRPLAGLIHLESLGLDGNQITDISPLLNLTDLTHLGLSGNQIIDIGPLVNLTNLKSMGLSGNQISDIRPLAGLIHLESLGLGGNQISNLSPLENLTKLKTLYATGNPLINDITPLANLTQLMRLRLSGQSISDITPLANLTQLTHLRLDNNQIRDISPLANLALLEELHIGNNPIHDLSPLLELKGVELDIEIDLSQLDKLNVIVEIPDSNLERAIRDALYLPEDIPLTQGQMQSLAQFAVEDSGLTDLTGLEYATFLRYLKLGRNQIRALDPLAGLIHLENLELNENQITDISPLANLTNLKNLGLAGNQIRNLTPLASLIHLENLDLSKNQITDIFSLVNLINLKYLTLAGNQLLSDIAPLSKLIQLKRLHLSKQSISDITPLANLEQLTYLNLEKNYISDFSPLANLFNLEELWINQNLGTNFSPLQGLSLTHFIYDEVCETEPLLPPVRERIQNRNFPSVFQPWDDIVGLDHLTWEQRNVLHDLHWYPNFDHTIRWHVTSAESTEGLATSLVSSLTLTRAHEVRERRLEQNPNMVFLGGIGIQSDADDLFPPDSDFWLRDDNGEILRKEDGAPMINFLKPEVQDLIVKRIIAFERCGLYDGVFFDGFASNGAGFGGRYLYRRVTDEEIIQAMLNIFSTARAQVRDDFLIVINSNRSKPTRYTEYVNGIMMETGKDYPGGYTHGGLFELENTLSWAEENLREPQINCLEGEGMSIEPPDGPNNSRWMRVFTTLSLTHSDGYVIYTTGFRDFGPPHPDHNHLWHDFWDTNLGQPIGPKAQQYKNIPGLFIREFTKGWAVYNRSGKAQAITLPESVTGVSSGKSSTTHQLPDLDGEMYLKAPNPADVNGDGKINVLDLVQVTNGLGKAAPDPNGDGVVNVLDLVFIAQQFSQ